MIRRATTRLVACGLLALAATSARASFLSGEALDTMADILALVVLFIVPAGAIVLFWIVHVLPEKIAHKRHHPQRDAITTLCLLSLVFGGLLWPFAWLWAYTRPVGYKLAYGTDRSDDYYAALAEKARNGELDEQELARIDAELQVMQGRGTITPAIGELRGYVEQAKATTAASKVDARVEPTLPPPEPERRRA